MDKIEVSAIAYLEKVMDESQFVTGNYLFRGEGSYAVFKKQFQKHFGLDFLEWKSKAVRMVGDTEVEYMYIGQGIVVKVDTLALLSYSAYLLKTMSYRDRVIKEAERLGYGVDNKSITIKPIYDGEILDEEWTVYPPYSLAWRSSINALFLWSDSCKTEDYEDNTPGSLRIFDSNQWAPIVQSSNKLTK